MSLSQKSARRVKLLKRIMSDMREHDMFSNIVSRVNDTESYIQKNVFLSLEKVLKSNLIEYGLSEKKSNNAVESFKWEQKVTTTVNNFTVFSTNHRPDAVLDIGDIRIGIEIKKGDSGAALRSGLGQCVLYGTEYDFVLYLFVDITPNQNIAKSINGEREQEVVNGLWENHNVMLSII